MKSRFQGLRPQWWLASAVFLVALLATTATMSRAAERYRDGFDALEQGDYSEAFRLLKPLAEQGNVAAQLNLGTFYYHGRGVTRDTALSAHWFGEAARRGNMHGQYRLGQLYMRGEGVPQDAREGARLYELAAQQGNIHAQTSLGGAYHSGVGGLPVDHARAVHWWEKAATAGNASAQAFLGNAYLTGRGVPQNFAAASQLFLSAAEQGESVAAWGLGTMEEEGQGKSRDLVEAYVWYSIAVALDATGDGGPTMAKDRDRVSHRLTREQLTAAQERSQTWFDAFRARNRNRREP